MIRVRIPKRKDPLEKRFNGLVVILDVEESGGRRCARCDEEEPAVVTRRFNVARVARGAVNLRKETAFFREVEGFVKKNMGHEQCLCLDCFEKITDDNLGGFEPAN